MDRIIVDEVARVVQDWFTAVDLYPLEDVRAVPVIDVHPPVQYGTGEPTEKGTGPLYHVRAPVVGEHDGVRFRLARGHYRRLYSVQDIGLQGHRQIIRSWAIRPGCEGWFVV